MAATTAVQRDKRSTYGVGEHEVVRYRFFEPISLASPQDQYLRLLRAKEAYVFVAEHLEVKPVYGVMSVVYQTLRLFLVRYDLSGARVLKMQQDAWAGMLTCPMSVSEALVKATLWDLDTPPQEWSLPSVLRYIGQSRALIG